MATGRRPKSELKVVPFVNQRAGTVSWRVKGSIAGRRVRKNFKTQGKMEAYRATRLAGIVRDLPPAPIMTNLSIERVRAAEVAAAGLAPGTTLCQAVAFFAEHGRPVVDEQIAAAAGEWKHWLTAERKAKEETAHQGAKQIELFAHESEIEMMNEISAAECKEWFLGVNYVRSLGPARLLLPLGRAGARRRAGGGGDLSPLENHALPRKPVESGRISARVTIRPGGWGSCPP